jgi:hypothetical protein
MRAAAVWAFVTAPYAIGLAMLLANGRGLGSSVNVRGSVFLTLTYGILAGVLIAYVPRHRISWLFAATATFGAVDVLVGGLVDRALASGSAGEATSVLAAVESVLWFPQLWSLLAILFLFPDGRLISPSWRPWFAAMTLAMGAGLIAYVTLPGRIDQWPAIENPLGVVGADGLRRTYAQAMTPVVAVIAVVSVLVRFRSARGDERAQLKLFAFAGVAAGLALVPGALLYFAPPPLSTIAVTVATIPLAFFFPLAIGAAILRYRLYEIDVIVRRTLVYGALSVVLVVTYLMLVVVIQAGLRPFTAGSELAVAGSTLATLAFVQPLRRRIQEVVDHRFYRSHYDAIRTVDAFAGRLRDQVDLDSVQMDLLGVVAEAVKPAHAGVWLRGR